MIAEKKQTTVKTVQGSITEEYFLYCFFITYSVHTYLLMFSICFPVPTTHQERVRFGNHQANVSRGPGHEVYNCPGSTQTSKWSK